VSKKQHDKQVARARDRRRATALQRRTRRNRIIVIAVVGIMVVALVASTAISGGLFGGDDPAVEPPPEDDDEPQATEGPCGPTPDDVPDVDSPVYDAPFDMTISQDVTYVATLDTTCGAIVIELDAQNAPIATNNFVNLAGDGYYDGVHFHRVIPEFVIQAGDPAGTGCGQPDCTPEGFDPDAPTFPGYSFEDELDRAEELYAEVETGYPRGTVAMANSGEDSNGSQFFVTQGDPTQLPGPSFTVLGVVLDGMDVVDDIVASPTNPEDEPLERVVIRSVTIEER